MSVTNSWLVRDSETTLPRAERMRDDVPPPLP
jgi:hypothetical protein